MEASAEDFAPISFKKGRKLNKRNRKVPEGIPILAST